ncbi:lipopolysaccharide biosynthesis protein [Bacteroides gallinaceum]|uniref:lipopolysaccharide biosynthesis protein n=1 Tax=Bacteroides gallinaceum TaxID=1462571 RepID=UPI0025AA5522|nr:lipopolysaccharide biosynthesis protein [Bacteroides gallinaceum]MDN0066370.1 lipopolysaccharide biosynthesis protein [Bacteroides gallinaceum]
MSLRQQAFKGIMWNLTDNLAVQVIQFVTSIYMARILSPSDYGLMGMLLIFTALSDAIMNGGFSTALIRKTDRTDTDAATAFYFNIVVGLALYGCLFLLAPAIAAFYKVPLLQDLIKVAAIPFVVNAFFLVQRTYLTIRMDFKTQAKISVVSALAKGGTGIGMAYAGYGVWAIAWSGVAGATISCILYWWHSVWKLRFCFSWRSFRELFGFGSKLMLSGVLDVLGNNLFTLIIGKKFAASSLGYYTRAYGYASLPPTVLTGVLSRVTLPMLSQMQDDNERLAKVYRQMLRLAAFIVFPLMIGIALLARPLIVLMITDKWLPCVEYMQLLCFAFMLYPIHALNLNLLQVKGRSDLFLRLEIIKKGLMLGLLIVALPFGIRAICIGGIVSSFLAWILNTYYTGKLIRVGFWKQMKDVLPVMGYTTVMGIAVYFVRINTGSDVTGLLWGTLAGIVSYIIVTFGFRAKEMRYLMNIIKSYQPD